jgi:riboflavin kinase/FMN adenylyltransferase
MQHIQDLNSLHLDGCVLTIGSFDGVHRGHQVLIKAMVADAQAAGIPSVVLTFYPHPSVVLRGRQPTFYITTPDEKAKLLGDLGVEFVISKRFDLELSKMSAASFLDILQTKLAFQCLWVGDDFALGHQRIGNRLFLEQASVERGFQLHVVAPASAGGEVISSTRVREALRSGDVARVATYLDRPFVIPGKVIKGSSRGKKLGFPTANLAIWKERAYPGPGVYACLVEVEGKQWQAVTNIGVRPTFEVDEATRTIETHLLDFDGDLYSREIAISFIDRLRDERRFPNPEALLTQIERDIRRARVILNQKTKVVNV